MESVAAGGIAGGDAVTRTSSFLSRPDSADENR